MSHNLLSSSSDEHIKPIAKLGSNFENGVLFALSQWNVELSKTSKSEAVESSNESFDEDDNDDSEDVVKMDRSYDE